MVSESSISDSTAYWSSRKDILYYEVVRILASSIGATANSILDVGSAGCPYLGWFDWIEHKVSIDVENPYKSAGVESLKKDFLTWETEKKFDVVLCLQVLEHVQDAEQFAKKLLALGKTVIVSVPYKWDEMKTEEHIHDPVDKIKMKKWFGRDPNFEYVCTEVLAPVDRLIQVYDPFETPWSGLKQRQRMIRALLAKDLK